MNDQPTQPVQTKPAQQVQAKPVQDQAAPPVQAQPVQPDANGNLSQQIGKYKVEVIRDLCISAASCVAIAPKVFQLDEEDLAIIISQDGNDDETKLLAAQSCPTAAVIVTNTETGEQVWPKEQ